MDRSSPNKDQLMPLFFLSAATLVFEINLTRIFSVTQFYHFAFMIVSLALLGIGASGTFLTIFPLKPEGEIRYTLAGLCFGTAALFLGSYLLIQHLPFDSYAISVDKTQILIFVLHFFILALPFLTAGLVIGILLAYYSHKAGTVYSANLSGSAFGCLLALFLPNWLGGEGMVTFSTLLACFSALWFILSFFKSRNGHNQLALKIGVICLSIFVVFLGGFSLTDVSRRALGLGSFQIMSLKLSPYKSLSYALQFPGSRIIFHRWNAYSVVDVVQSAGIRALPGLSYRFKGLPPAEKGILVDGENLMPVIARDSDTAFTDYMPSAILYILKPKAKALILNAGGGLEVIIAESQGGSEITAVEANPLVAEAAGQAYPSSKTGLILDDSRSFVRRDHRLYDVIVLPLTSSYYPIQSGAYSLSENYLYTVESFEDILKRLEPDGLFLVNRWLQQPPSEWLRAFCITVSALEREGLDPRQHIVAFRTYNTGYLLIKKQPFTNDELRTIREFLKEKAYDIDYAPDIEPGEVNRYNKLQSPMYYEAFQQVLQTQPRRMFYRNYPYDVSPPTDNRPFFGHFFKWSQVDEILSSLGTTWQPFGGAGYLVELFLLFLAIFSSMILIVFPLMVHQIRGRRTPSQEQFSLRRAFPVLSYFSLLGLGYLLVEIPLIQQFILFLGYPAYALTAVLFSLLIFSGLGSRISYRINLRLGLGLLVVFLVIYLFFLPPILKVFLGYPFLVRIIFTVILLAPAGFLMGMMFPRGILAIEQTRRKLIPWAWAVNGSASVVASILSSILALSFGFNLVLAVGAACYGICWLIVPAFSPYRSQSRRL